MPKATVHLMKIKTEKMELWEYRYNKPIDRIILDALIDAKANAAQAAKAVGVSRAAFHHWISERQLTTEYLKIRKRFGWLIPESELDLLPEERLRQVEVEFNGPCKRHKNEGLEDIIKPVLSGVAIDYNNDMTYYGVIYDLEGKVHQFPIALKQGNIEEDIG